MALLARSAKLPQIMRLYQAAVLGARNKSKSTADEEKNYPLYIQHATGLERKELIARLKGNDDPFGLNAQKRGPGTKAEPNLVESYEDKRVIGCICDEDSTTINWIWVHKGDPKRCYCGHWFKLIDVKDPFY